MTQTIYHHLFIQEALDKPPSTFTIEHRIGIRAVDPDSSTLTHLSPLLFSHPTHTPTPDSTLLHSLVLLLLQNLVSSPYYFSTLLIIFTSTSDFIHLLYSSSLLRHLTSSLYSNPILLWLLDLSTLLPQAYNEDK